MVKQEKIRGIFFQSAILLIIGFLIPFTFISAKAELNNSDISNIFYSYNIILIGSLLGLLFIIAVKLYWNKNNRLGDSVGFFGGSPLVNNFSKNASILQKILYSYIFFGAVFLISIRFFPSGLTGLRLLPQQFSNFDNALFSSLLIPTSENLLFMFSLAFITLINQIIAVKFNFNKTDYLTALSISSFLILGLLGRFWHSTVYEGSDVALTIVFLFWAIGAIITIFLDNFWPFFVMHQLNNLFIFLSIVQSRDVAFFGILSMLVILVGISIFVFRNNLIPKRKMSPFGDIFK